jgi:hypothetical protein
LQCAQWLTHVLLQLEYLLRGLKETGNQSLGGRRPLLLELRTPCHLRASAGIPSIAPSLDSAFDFSIEPRLAEAPPSGAAGLCPEIDCLRGQLAADVIAEAEQRAAGVGVGADRVLIAAGAVDEESYAAALAAAVARRLACALSARGLALSLGKDRARPGAKLAAGRPRIAIAIETGALSQPLRGGDLVDKFGPGPDARDYI